MSTKDPVANLHVHARVLRQHDHTKTLPVKTFTVTWCKRDITTSVTALPNDTKGSYRMEPTTHDIARLKWPSATRRIVGFTLSQHACFTVCSSHVLRITTLNVTFEVSDRDSPTRYVTEKYLQLPLSRLKPQGTS